MERDVAPVSRSDLRLALGARYYTLLRSVKLIGGGYKFASVRECDAPFTVFTHETPLLRDLKNADMQLQRNKIVNLRLASARLDGVVLRPGETLSYWHLIKKPTRRRGYIDGMILRNGEVRSGVGGGLCQLANLIYWMTIHTELRVTERHRHGYDVFPDSNRTQPFGSGATCFYNYGDLMIKNESENTYRLRVHLTDTHLVGEWQSDHAPAHTYEVYEAEHIMRLEAWGGYSRNNVLRRRVLNADGVVIDDEFVVANRAVMMYAPLLAE
jgi:vancomycin resistance protein VanW